MTLDPSQRSAAERPLSASTNVVAGAGTGKTRVLVARYMKLVEDDGVPLDRILALTFTLKAAAEMRDRIRAEVVHRFPERAGLLPGAWILNFHQFGHRFIRENAPALGVDPGIDVISPAEFQRVTAWLRARFEAGRVDGVPLDFGGEPPSPTDLPSIFDTLMKVVHKCRDNMIDPRRLRELCRPDDHPAYVARVDTIVALATAWEAELRRRNLLGFSEMISIPARALMSDTALAARYRGAFDHILVDEFQDTSRAQNEMLRALAGDDFSRVTVVGDVKQAIYRWRDARTENVTEFPAERSELLVNYRSRQNILEIAHELVAHTTDLDGFAPKLEASRGAGMHPVMLFHPPGEEYSHELEARAVADWVLYLLGWAAAPADWKLAKLEPALLPREIAVLLRGFKRSRARRALEDEFLRRGIPYALIGGAASAEASALEAWHELLSLLLPGPRAVNLLAVLQARPFNISEASLHQLLERPRKATARELLCDERLQLITDERDAETVRTLRDELENLENALRRLGFREFLAWAIERTPLRLELAHAGVSPAAGDELVRELHDIADLLARHGVVSLAAFLDQLDATLDEKKFRDEGDVRLPDDRAPIMTIHQAKGLEFPAVAMVGVGPPAQGSSEHFVLSAGTGVYFSKATAEKWDRHKEKAPETEAEKRQEALEERCILYVALTRAQDHLWISSPYADGIGRGRGTRESLFTELLRLSREQDLAREVRTCGEAGERHPGAQVPGVADAEAEAALREWTALRAAAEARDLDLRPAPRELETITWASLARYEMCPYAFWLDCTERGAANGEEVLLEDALHDPPAVELPPGVDPAEFGAFVHAVLENRDDITAIERTVTRIAARYDFGPHAAAVMDLARARIAGACAAGLAGPSGGAQSELAFSVRVNRVLLHGVIDRLDTLKDGALITDYKLGSPHASHHFQVGVYAWAAQRILGAGSVRSRLVYLGYDPIRVDEVETDHARIGALVDALAAAMENALVSGEFVATPGVVCATCAHRTHCSFAAA